MAQGNYAGLKLGGRGVGDVMRFPRARQEGVFALSQPPVMNFVNPRCRNPILMCCLPVVEALQGEGCDDEAGFVHVPSSGCPRCLGTCVHDVVEPHTSGRARAELSYSFIDSEARARNSG